MNSASLESLRTVLRTSTRVLRYRPRVLFETDWDYALGLNGKMINDLALELFAHAVFGYTANDERRLLTVNHADRARPPIVWTIWSRPYGEHQMEQHDDFTAAIAEKTKFMDTIAYLESWQSAGCDPAPPAARETGEGEKSEASVAKGKQTTHAPSVDRQNDIIATIVDADMPLQRSELQHGMGMSTEGRLGHQLAWMVREGKLVNLPHRGYWPADRPIPE